MAKAKTLAALAGLAGLAYAMRNKGEEGPSATAAEKETSDARMNAQRDAVSGNSVTDTGDETNRLLARSPTPDYSNEGRNKPLKVSTPVVKPKPAVDNTTAAAIPSGIMGGARPATVNKNPNGTIEAPAASNRTDAMRNTSRAAAAADRLRKTGKQSFKSGGMTSSASSRADGIATKGKTRGKIC